MTALPLDVDVLVDEYNVGPLTVYRSVPPVQNQFGGYTKQTPTTFTLNPVAAHDVTGRDLDQVPEADRNRGIKQFYTKQRLYVADGGKQADVIGFEGRRYRMIKVWNEDAQGLVWIGQGALEEVTA